MKKNVLMKLISSLIFLLCVSRTSDGRFQHIDALQIPTIDATNAYMNLVVAFTFLGLVLWTWIAAKNKEVKAIKHELLQLRAVTQTLQCEIVLASNEKSAITKDLTTLHATLDSLRFSMNELYITNKVPLSAPRPEDITNQGKSSKAYSPVQPEQQPSPTPAIASYGISQSQEIPCHLPSMKATPSKSSAHLVCHHQTVQRSLQNKAVSPKPLSQTWDRPNPTQVSCKPGTKVASSSKVHSQTANPSEICAAHGSGLPPAHPRIASRSCSKPLSNSGHTNSLSSNASPSRSCSRFRSRCTRSLQILPVIYELDELV